MTEATDAQVEAAALAMQAHSQPGRRPTLGQFRALARVGLEAAAKITEAEKLRADVAEARSALGVVTPAGEI